MQRKGPDQAASLNSAPHAGTNLIARLQWKQKRDMSLIKCDECGREISDKAAACPGCGAPVLASTPVPAPAIELQQATAPADDKRGIVFAPIVIISVATAVAVLLSAISPDRSSKSQVTAAREADERNRLKHTIEYCEDRYKEMNADRQYTPDMLRFHSRACERMREDYKSRWGREA